MFISVVYLEIHSVWDSTVCASVCVRVQTFTLPGLPTAERVDGEVVWRQTSAVMSNESQACSDQTPPVNRNSSEEASSSPVLNFTLEILTSA